MSDTLFLILSAFVFFLGGYLLEHSAGHTKGYMEGLQDGNNTD